MIPIANKYGPNPTRKNTVDNIVALIIPDDAMRKGRARSNITIIRTNQYCFNQVLLIRRG
jgi:hypothetical protein